MGFCGFFLAKYYKKSKKLNNHIFSQDLFK